MCRARAAGGGRDATRDESANEGFELCPPDAAASLRRRSRRCRVPRQASCSEASRPSRPGAIAIPRLYIATTALPYCSACRRVANASDMLSWACGRCRPRSAACAAVITSAARDFSSRLARCSGFACAACRSRRTRRPARRWRLVKRSPRPTRPRSLLRTPSGNGAEAPDVFLHRASAKPYAISRSRTYEQSAFAPNPC